MRPCREGRGRGQSCVEKASLQRPPGPREPGFSGAPSVTRSELRPNTALGSVCLQPWALAFLPFTVHLPEGFVKPFQGPYLIVTSG